MLDAAAPAARPPHPLALDLLAGSRLTPTFPLPTAPVRLVTTPADGPRLNLPDLDALLDECPDERALLARLSTVIALGEDYLSEARRMRDYAALRLRQQGVPMTTIAGLAGVTDSYLARQSIKAGSKRRRVAPAQRVEEPVEEADAG